jgi:peptide chain release factor subunit 1
MFLRNRTGTSGKDGFMTSTVTDNVLRTLSGFRAENGCAISLYIDLDPSSTATASQAETRFNSLLSELEKEAETHGGARDCRLALKDDLARIRSWWDDEFDRDGTQGVAIFASSADGEFRALPLPEPVRDLVRIGSELVVAPLAGQLGRDGSLVVVLSRERGTVYRFAGGRLVEIVDETEEAPGRHSQGGWSQARYQRHIEHLVQQHLKTVGQEIDKQARGTGGLQLVIVAPDELRSEIESTLSSEAREAVVGWATAEAHAAPTDLLEIVRPLLDAARARAEQEELERWQEEHGRGGRAAAGWKQTLDAASDGRVAVLLVDESSTGHEAWVCPKCGRASADGGKCALDDTRLEPASDAAELAIHRAIEHGGSVVGLGAGALGDAAGIGAILRY